MQTNRGPERTRLELAARLQKRVTAGDGYEAPEDHQPDPDPGADTTTVALGCESVDDEPESNDRQRRPNPGEQRAFVRQVVAYRRLSNGPMVVGHLAPSVLQRHETTF